MLMLSDLECLFFHRLVVLTHEMLMHVACTLLGVCLIPAKICARWRLALYVPGSPLSKRRCLARLARMPSFYFAYQTW